MAATTPFPLAVPAALPFPVLALLLTLLSALGDSLQPPKLPLTVGKLGAQSVDGVQAEEFSSPHQLCEGSCLA